MKRTLNLATLVALLSLVVLVMTGCTNQNPAPAERMVNLDALPTLYKGGKDTTFTSYSSTDFRWRDCDGKFHPAKKFVPSGLMSFNSEGPLFNLREEIGLQEGEELFIRKKLMKEEPRSSYKQQVMAPITGLTNAESDDAFFPDWLKNLLTLLAFVVVFVALWKIIRGGAHRNHTPPTTDHHPGTNGNRGDTTILNSHVEHHNVEQKPNMKVTYRGEGEYATEFQVIGEFSLPLEVKVAKGNEPATTVTFGRPETSKDTEKTS